MIPRRVVAAFSLALALLLVPGLVLAQEFEPFEDFPVPSGHFYSQASGQGLAAGYSIADDGGVSFWREMNRLGGVESVGYPASRRFEQGGFVHQATQRFLLQWRPELGRAVYANTFDVLSAAGRDDWLQRERMIPPPADWSGDRGLPWDQVVARHLALLDRNPALKRAYMADDNPVETFGLPQSYADMGPAIVLRTQRAAFQLWKVPTSFARVGQVTTVNGGDLAKESGLLPPDATTPEPTSTVLVAPPGQPLVATADVLASARRAAALGRTSTVEIVAPLARGQSQGTGIVLDAAGHILTANHVVEDAKSVQVVLPDGRTITATKVARDRLTDLAVVTAPLPAGSVQPAQIGDPAALRGGDYVVAVGYSPYFPARPTNRIGVFNGRDPNVVDTLRTETFILPGDSGGPLFDLRGRVIGVNSSIMLSRSRATPIIGSSIDVASAAAVVSELIANGRVARPFLGVQTVSVNPRLAAVYSLPTRVGAVVTDVGEGSPAAAAGIRPGDTIIAIDGQTIGSTRDLASNLSGHKIGDAVLISLVAPGGAPRIVKAQLGPSPE